MQESRRFLTCKKVGGSLHARKLEVPYMQESRRFLTCKKVGGSLHARK